MNINAITIYETRTASQKIMRCAGGIETFVMQ